MRGERNLSFRHAVDHGWVRARLAHSGAMISSPGVWLLGGSNLEHAGSSS